MKLNMLYEAMQPVDKIYNADLVNAKAVPQALASIIHIPDMMAFFFFPWASHKNSTLNDAMTDEHGEPLLLRIDKRNVNKSLKDAQNFRSSLRKPDMWAIGLLMRQMVGIPAASRGPSNYKKPLLKQYGFLRNVSPHH